jgi:hypothetical protein
VTLRSGQHTLLFFLTILSDYQWDDSALEEGWRRAMGGTN